MSSSTVIGIVGGTGLYNLDGLTEQRWVRVDSPFGTPSDELLFGKLGDQRVVFLPRHGRGHRIPPHEINFLANIDALKRAGVTSILSVSAVGSLRADLPPALAGRVDLLGQVSEADKARMLRSVDVYCAPNMGGESFGIILLEAMAAGTPILASDLDAFRRVLDDGRAGTLFPTGDPAALARCLGQLLDDPPRRARLAAVGSRVVAAYDWPVVTRQVLAVYETVIAAVPVVVTPDNSDAPDLVGE